MSVSFEAAIDLKEEGQTPKSNDSANTYINPDWDDSALFNFVSTHQNEPVRVGGAVMTLSEAMSLHPGPWTAENEPNLIAYAQELYDNRVAETKEPEKEDQPEEDQPLKTEATDQENDVQVEAQTARVKPNTDDNTKQPEKMPEDAKPRELVANQLEVIAEPQISYGPVAEVGQVAEPVHAEPKQSIEGSAKSGVPTTVSSKSSARAEAGNPSTNISAGKTSTKNLHTTSESPAKSGTSLRSETKPVTTKTAQELRIIPAPAGDKLNERVVAIKPVVDARVPKLALEIPESDPVVEPKAIPHKPAHDTGQDIKALVLPEILDVVPAPEHAELSISELENVAVLEDTIELSD